jgi:hypothetical protein
VLGVQHGCSLASTVTLRATLRSLAARLLNAGWDDRG